MRSTFRKSYTPEPGTSAIDSLHCRFRVSVSGGSAMGRGLVKLRQVMRGQRKFQRGQVLFQVGTAGGAGDGDNPFALRQHPGQREL